MRILRGVVLHLLCLLPLALGPTIARADDEGRKAEARKDKADAEKDAHDTRRAINKADHRIDEADCSSNSSNPKECARRKRVNRVQEAKEQASDEIHEAADRTSDAKNAKK